MYFDKQMRFNEELLGKIQKGRKRDDSLTEEFFAPNPKNKLVKTVLPDKQLEYTEWRLHIKQQIILTEKIINTKEYAPFFHEIVNKNY